MSDNVIQAIREFWEAHPVAAASIGQCLGTAEYFRDYDRLREKNEGEQFSDMLHEYRDFAGKKVLDVGCGNGYVLSKYAKEGATVFGIDLTRAGIRLSRQRFALSLLHGHFTVGNAEWLPYPSETFDCVCSMGVLHHIPDIRKGINEIHRVLKPGGRFISMLYNKNSASYRYNMFLNHLRTGKPMAQTVREVDGTRNPKGEVYSRSEVRQLLRNFKKVECFTGLIQPEMLPKIGRIVPNGWIRLFERSCGWFLYSKARK